jgi:hypothetical protein
MGDRKCQGLLPQDTQRQSHSMCGIILFVCLFFQPYRHYQWDRRQPPLAVAGPLNRLLGGVPISNPQDRAQELHHLKQSRVYLGFDLVDVDLDGSAH